MCKLKDLPKYTNRLITAYAGRKLFLEGQIPGVRLGGPNSPILIDLDGLEKWLETKSQANVKVEQPEGNEYGKLRKIM